MGVSKNKGTPKWMVKIMENLIKMDDLGVPLFSETLIFSTHTSVRGSFPIRSLFAPNPWQHWIPFDDFCIYF